jgi:hypothetical protein
MPWRARRWAGTGRFHGIGRDRQESRPQRAISFVVLLAVLLGILLPGAPSYAAPLLPLPAPQEDAAGFAACDDLTEDQVRTELNAIAQQIFAQGAPVDLAEIVARQWALLDMDRVVDQAVADAADQAQRSETMVNTALSGWSPARAEEMTATVAELAFASEQFRAALDDLSAAVALDLEAQLGALSAESASLNLLCLQQFIERQYSASVVTAFSESVRAGADDVTYTPGDEVDGGLAAVLQQHKPAIGGLGVIIAAQISRRMLVRMGRTISRRVAGRITGRLLGRVGATVIPLAGWIIGGGLIVYDVIDSLDGALPQIENALQAPEVKLAIQQEIVRSVEPELRRELPQMARSLADDLYAEWLDFKRQYRQLLTLAESSPDFAAIMGAVPDVGTLAALLDAAITTLGADGVDAAVADGTFAQLAALPPGAEHILRTTGAAASTLAWADLAGPRLDDVIATELYKVRAPDALTPAQLEALLRVQDSAIVAKLGAVDGPALDGLMTVSSTNLSRLSELLSSEQLTVMGSLLASLDTPRRQDLVTAVLDNPAAAGVLDEDLLPMLLTASDLPAALAFVSTPADPAGYFGDLLNVGRGEVSARLFAAKYGWPVTGGTVVVPLLLVISLVYTVLSVMLRPFVGVARLFGRRRRA